MKKFVNISHPGLRKLIVLRAKLQFIFGSFQVIETRRGQLAAVLFLHETAQNRVKAQRQSGWAKVKQINWFSLPRDVPEWKSASWHEASLLFTGALNRHLLGSCSNRTRSESTESLNGTQTPGGKQKFLQTFGDRSGSAGVVLLARSRSRWNVWRWARSQPRARFCGSGLVMI